MKDGHFEAKKHAYRQTQDGVVISFVVHPNDISEALAMAPLGTRFMVGFAEIGDGETCGRQDGQPPVPEVTAPHTATTEAAPARSKRKFSELSLPEQAGITCEDAAFTDWILNTFYKVADQNVREISTSEFVRLYCGVQSRSELSTNRDAANRWRELRQKFESWQLAERYADVRR